MSEHDIEIMEEAEHCLKFGKLVDNFVAHHLVERIKRQEAELAAVTAALTQSHASQRGTLAEMAKDVAESAISHRNANTALAAEAAKLRAALESQITWWENVPSGVDYEADLENESPVDTTAHMAGLAIREARAALAWPKPNTEGSHAS